MADQLATPWRISQNNHIMMHMKKLIIFLTMALLAGCQTTKLPPAREVAKDYRSEYRESVNYYQYVAKELKRAGWEIVTDPIESVPTEVSEVRSMADEGNWGERILLPPDIKARLVRECPYKVHLKIADTAGKWDHKDLQQGQQTGRNYTTSTVLDDLHGHSTHVGGIALADGFGMLDALIDAGKATATPIKVLGDLGQGSFTWVATMIDSEGADNARRAANGEYVVFNGSFGGGTAKQTAVEAALKRSTDAGVLYVFAAGNTAGPVEYPGNSEYAITTSSMDESLTLSSFSSRGPEVDNGAPGRGIMSTWKSNNYAWLSGTSMASPFLAGAVAIAKARWGDRIKGVQGMKNYFAKISTDLKPDGKDDATGWGIAYVKAILDTAPEGGPADPPTDPPTGANLIGLQDGGFFMTWRRESDRSNSLLLVPNVRANVRGEAGKVALYDQAKAFLVEYFNSRVIVLTDDMDAGDAAFWTGRFLEIIAEQQGIAWKTTELWGQDQARRLFIVTDFNPKGSEVLLRRVRIERK